MSSPEFDPFRAQLMGSAEGPSGAGTAAAPEGRRAERGEELARGLGSGLEPAQLHTGYHPARAFALELVTWPVRIHLQDKPFLTCFVLPQAGRAWNLLDGRGEIHWPVRQSPLSPEGSRCVRHCARRWGPSRSQGAYGLVGDRRWWQWEEGWGGARGRAGGHKNGHLRQTQGQGGPWEGLMSKRRLNRERGWPGAG